MLTHSVKALEKHCARTDTQFDKREQNGSKPGNYNPFNRKISFEFMISLIYSAADILRGSPNSGEQSHPIMSLLFLRRLKDSYEKNAENQITGGKN